MARILEQKHHQAHRTESLADHLSFRDRDRDGFRTDNLNSVARKSIMPWKHGSIFGQWAKEII